MVELKDVLAARERVRDALYLSPCARTETLSRVSRTQAFLKLDNLQMTGAYKERGALNKLLTLGEAERARGLIAASAGNHAQAVAYHAGRLGISATIVMPETTPIMKVANTRGHVLQRYSWYNRQLDQAFGYFGDDPAPLSPGTVDYKLRLPTAVTMDSSERVYLLDSKHTRVLALDQDGKLLWESHPESGGQGLSRPQGMICHQDFLYVADTGNNRILKLDLQGKVAGEQGGIADPHGISIFGGRMAIAQRKEKTVRIVEAF